MQVTGVGRGVQCKVVFKGGSALILVNCDRGNNASAVMYTWFKKHNQACVSKFEENNAYAYFCVYTGVWAFGDFTPKFVRNVTQWKDELLFVFFFFYGQKELEFSICFCLWPPFAFSATQLLHFALSYPSYDPPSQTNLAPFALPVPNVTLPPSLPPPYTAPASLPLSAPSPNVTFPLLSPSALYSPSLAWWMASLQGKCWFSSLCLISAGCY